MLFNIKINCFNSILKFEKYPFSEKVKKTKSKYVWIILIFDLIEIFIINEVPKSVKLKFLQDSMNSLIGISI